MSKADWITFFIYSAIVGTLIANILSGPLLGLPEYLLSFGLSILAWFAGTSIVAKFTGTPVQTDKSFREQMWGWVLATAVGLVILCVAYKFLVTNGRSSYPAGLLILHFFVVFAASTAARVMVFCAKRAISSSDIAKQRAKKASDAKQAKKRASLAAKSGNEPNE